MADPFFSVKDDDLKTGIFSGNTSTLARSLHHPDVRPLDFQNLSEANSFHNVLYDTDGSTLSASRWQRKTFSAFRVVPIYNLNPNRVVPGYDDSMKKAEVDLAYKRMLKNLSAATEADLSSDPLYTAGNKRTKGHNSIPLDSGARPMSNFLSNPFFAFFAALRDLRTRRLTEKDIFEDDSSEEDEGNKGEQGSEELLHRFIEVILVYHNTRHRFSEDRLRSTPHHLSLDVSVKDEEDVAVKDEEEDLIKCSAVDDGYLYISGSSKVTGGNRFSKIPVVRYEAKTLDVIVTAKKPQQINDDYRATAQQFAQMLSCIQLDTKSAPQIVSNGLETFSIRIAHTYLSIARVYTSKAYLEDILQNTRPTTKEQPYIYFQQTEQFDLLTKGGREQAAKAIWALLLHLKSGNALIGRLAWNRRQPGGSIPIWGLENPKDTCFMNAVFQCLAGTTELFESKGRQEVVIDSMLESQSRAIEKTNENLSKWRTALTEMFAELIYALRVGERTDALRDQFEKSYFGYKEKKYPDHGPYDACQFLNFILFEESRELNYLAPTFCGKQKSVVNCLCRPARKSLKLTDEEEQTTDHISETPFYVLQLSQDFTKQQISGVPVNVANAIESSLQIREAFECPKINAVSSTVQQTKSFTRLPRVLIISLDRFRIYLNATQGKKYRERVTLFDNDLPVRLDGGSGKKYHLYAMVAHRADDDNLRKELDEKLSQELDEDLRKEFDEKLKALDEKLRKDLEVTFGSKGVAIGQYIAYVQYGPKDKQQWYECTDNKCEDGEPTYTEIKTVNPETDPVLKEFIERNALLLFYREVDEMSG